MASDVCPVDSQLIDISDLFEIFPSQGRFWVIVPKSRFTSIQSGYAVVIQNVSAMRELKE